MYIAVDTDVLIARNREMSHGGQHIEGCGVGIAPSGNVDRRGHPGRSGRPQLLLADGLGEARLHQLSEDLLIDCLAVALSQDLQGHLAWAEPRQAPSSDWADPNERVKWFVKLKTVSDGEFRYEVPVFNRPY